MTPRKKRTDPSVNLTIGGDVVDGQIAVGSNIQMRKSVWGEEKAKALQKLTETLKAQVKKEAPPDLLAEALENVSALKAIIASSKPDLSQMEAIRVWLILHIPVLAGTLDAISREFK